jgi:hypothetical protein
MKSTNLESYERIVYPHVVETASSYDSKIQAGLFNHDDINVRFDVTSGYHKWKHATEEANTIPNVNPISHSINYSCISNDFGGYLNDRWGNPTSDQLIDKPSSAFSTNFHTFASSNFIEVR